MMMTRICGMERIIVVALYIGRFTRQIEPPPAIIRRMGAALEIRVFTLGPFATNCYVLWPSASSQCWIIDASFQPAPLIEAVREAGLTPSLLILTHAHLDHIAGVEQVRAAFADLPVLIHEAERDWLADPDLNLSSTFGLPITARPPDRLLREGDVLKLGALGFHILHTPGHSPGGIGLYNPETRTLFAGDTLFFDSIGRTDFPNADQATLLNSIQHKLLVLPDETRVLPGHGQDTTIGREKRHNPFLLTDATLHQ
jgi:hydroxyacylglutathione hydrolase